MQIMPRKRKTILRLTTVLLLLLLNFATLLATSQARTVDVSPEKSETITFIHDDDKIDIYRSHGDDDDIEKGLETDEDNEVISVRLLNSFQLLKPYADLQKEEEEEEQNVSYENMLESEDGMEEMTSRNASTAMTSLVETTSSVSTSTSSSPTTSRSSTVATATLDRSRLEDLESVEDSTVQHISTTKKPMILTKRPSSITTSTTLQPAASTSTINPVVITPHPPVFGTRKRKTRNHNDYYQYPSIDLDQLDFDDFDYSEVDGMRLKELLSTRFVAASSEQHNRDQPASKDCPCATEKPQPPSVIAEYYDDYQDYRAPPPPPPPVVPLTPQQGRFARRKRLHRQQPDISDESLLTAPAVLDASSMERAERMHGALERIMGIVTIMSHVDSFIQKKTKQSIRRLARLYESSEK